jgi:hypothetical protein
MNNFDYNNSVLLLKKVPFLQNGFVILMEDTRLSSPISILHYEKYSSKEDLEKTLSTEMNNLQCIVSEEKITDESLNRMTVKFGESQKPALDDYADRVDTLDFLLRL